MVRAVVVAALLEPVQKAHGTGSVRAHKQHYPGCPHCFEETKFHAPAHAMHLSQIEFSCRDFLV